MIKDDAKRFALYPARTWLREEWRPHTLGLHPPPQVLAGIIDLGDDKSNLRDPPLKLALAKVGSCRSNDIDFAIDQEFVASCSSRQETERVRPATKVSWHDATRSRAWIASSEIGAVSAMVSAVGY